MDLWLFSPDSPVEVVAQTTAAFDLQLTDGQIIKLLTELNLAFKYSNYPLLLLSSTDAVVTSLVWFVGICGGLLSCGLD